MGSGPGSSALYNREFLRFLRKHIEYHKFRSIIDFGCGDWQMFQNFCFRGLRYSGYDVVQTIVAKNSRMHTAKNVSFHCIESVEEITQGADIFLIKDVFIHLPNTVSKKIIHHAKTISKMVLIVNDYLEDGHKLNADIEAGGYRPVDITMRPFCEKAITVLKYGTQYKQIRTSRSLMSAVFGEHVQSGRKHVQLILGDVMVT